MQGKRKKTQKIYNKRHCLSPTDSSRFIWGPKVQCSALQITFKMHFGYLLKQKMSILLYLTFVQLSQVSHWCQFSQLVHYEEQRCCFWTNQVFCCRCLMKVSSPELHPACSPSQTHPESQEFISKHNCKSMEKNLKLISQRCM